MPVFRNHTVFDIARGVQGFLLEAGLTRGAGSADTQDRQAKDPEASSKNDVAKQSEFVKAAARNLRRETKIAETAGASVKSFRALKGEEGLEVHLGLVRTSDRVG